jgi:hypothetical protein
MQQHAIPQDVTGYRFNLFGKLNLSQFLQLLIPVGLAVIIWKIGVPLILTVPIDLILVLYGVMAAFVPIAGRPMSHWALTFLHNLYLPTKFYWKKGEFVPDYFDDGALEAPPVVIDSTDSLWGEGEKMMAANNYFSSIRPLDEDPLEMGQQLQIDSILGSFDEVPVAKVEAVARVIKPNVSDSQTLRQRQITESSV